MFDFQRLRIHIQEYYAKLFRPYNKPEETAYFIKRWLDIIRSYSTSKDFLSFDPTTPVLNRLKPKAKAVIVTSFPNVQLPFRLPFTSVFPFYPFRVKKEIYDEKCNIGLEFLVLYLELTGIKTVCLYNMYSRLENMIADDLQKKFPDIEIYGKGSYDSFKKKVFMNLKSGSNGSRSQSRLKGVKGTVSRQDVL